MSGAVRSRLREAAGTLRLTASSQKAIRERNASAWLLPEDGTRFDHRLVEHMRRFDDTEEVDLVVVGCGAGGATLTQRMAHAGWSVVCLEAGPFWDPDTHWVSDEALPPPVLDRTAGHLRHRPRPDGLQQLRPRRGRFDRALRRLRAALPPLRLLHPQRRRRRRRLADPLRGPAALLRTDRAGAAGRRASTGPGATRTPTRTPRTRSAATARSCCAAPTPSG
ncbi:hypothetical protein ACFQ1I_04765 [Kitasatospora arboriphila]